MQTRARVCVQTHSCLQTPPHARVHTDGHTPPCPQTCAPHTRTPARTCVRGRGGSEERRGLRGPWLLGAGLGGLRPNRTLLLTLLPNPHGSEGREGSGVHGGPSRHQHRRGVRRRPTEVCWEQRQRRTPSGPDAGGPAPRSPLPAAPRSRLLPAPGSRLLPAPRSRLPAPGSPPRSLPLSYGRVQWGLGTWHGGSTVTKVRSSLRGAARGLRRTAEAAPGAPRPRVKGQRHPALPAPRACRGPPTAPPWVWHAQKGRRGWKDSSQARGADRAPGHSPEGRQVLRVPHRGVEATGESHVDVEAHARPCAHLCGRESMCHRLD